MHVARRLERKASTSDRPAGGATFSIFRLAVAMSWEQKHLSFLIISPSHKSQHSAKHNAQGPQWQIDANSSLPLFINMPKQLCPFLSSKLEAEGAQLENLSRARLEPHSANGNENCRQPQSNPAQCIEANMTAAMSIGVRTNHNNPNTSSFSILYVDRCF